MQGLLKKCTAFILMSFFLSAMGIFCFLEKAAAEEIPLAPGESVNVSNSNMDIYARVYANGDDLGVIWRHSDQATSKYNLMYYDGENTVVSPLTALPNIYDTFYQIDGEWVAWSSSSSNVVELWSRTTNQVLQLSTKGFQSMDMDNGNVAWVERSGGVDCIKFYDGANGTTATINVPDNKYAGSVQVTGDLLFFRDSINKLYCYDGEQLMLIDTISNDYHADQGQVLYDKGKDDYTDSIYLWDSATGTKTLITDAGNYKKNLRLDNGNALWIDTYFGSLKLYYYDGSDISQIVAPDSLRTLDDNSNAELHNGLIVWDLYRYSGFMEIMLYDTLNAQMYQVSANAISDNDPVVNNSYIAWWSPEGIRLFHYTLPQVQLILEAVPAEGGNVLGAGLYDQNCQVTARANPAEGFRFINWTEDGAEVSNSADYAFIINADRTLQAHFDSSNLSVLPVAQGYMFNLSHMIDNSPDQYFGQVYKDGIPYAGSTGEVNIDFSKQAQGSDWEYVHETAVAEWFPLGSYEMKIFSNPERTVQVSAVPFTIIPMLHITSPDENATTSIQDIDITGFISNYSALGSVDSLELTLNEESQDILNCLDLDTGEFTVPVSLQSGDNSYSIRVDYTCPSSNSDGYEIWGQINYALDECFIATAAYGSKFEPSVALLRNFRDDYLLRSSFGHTLVDLYYDYSPPMANYIAQDEVCRSITRILLTPVLAVVYFFYHPGLGWSILLLIAGLAVLYRKGSRLQRKF